MPGHVDGRLAPCPSSPNCVSSEADPSDRRHHVAPLDLQGEPSKIQPRLKRILLAMPRATLVREEPGYLHLTFTTRWFRWVDDLELRFAPEEGVIHIRSASRTGHSDLGVNRRRVEALRRALEPAPHRAN